MPSPKTDTRGVNPLNPETTEPPVLAPKPTAAGGITAIKKAFDIAVSNMGLGATAKVFLSANQVNGFDCPSCAWPDPDGRREMFEFCENGAKSFAEEATHQRLTPEFFANYSVEQLSEMPDHWLSRQGRLTEPMVLHAGSEHYEPITWDAAFALIGRELKKLSTPDEAVFYTSGRTSNEAAFLYQLFVRLFGTNNLPDCSNMCHESSGRALGEVIGWNRSTIHLDDLEHAECILLLGINPGTNMPRMMTSLMHAADNGATIVAINPMPEVGFLRFRHPQQVRGILGQGAQLAKLYLQVKINGDVALLKGVMKLLVERNAIDKPFIDQYTENYEALAAHLAAASWEDIEQSSGIDRARIEELADVLTKSKATVICWAMGLTQHTNGVANVRELANLLLLQGNVGKPNAGFCCVRGHSNVQGDRTMGINERPPAPFLDRLAAEFQFEPPRHHGFDAVSAIQAMHDGRAKVLIALGGNLLSAAPDTLYTAKALENCSLTVQVSTKLNRSHLVTGDTALILPCIGRTEEDTNQFVTTENTTCQVRASYGKLKPASENLKSEVAIVAGIAKATLPKSPSIDWDALAANYDLIRDRIEKVVPAYENYNARVRESGGFYLDMPPRRRVFQTSTGKAKFTINPIPSRTIGRNQYVMMTIRSHDQFNTTIYDLDDRYRGIYGGRRVILMNAQDIKAAGLAENQLVNLTSHFTDGLRHAPRFRVVAYDLPRGCTATYFPETNVLVPVSSVAEGSNTPTSKYVVISIEPADEDDAS